MCVVFYNNKLTDNDVKIDDDDDDEGDEGDDVDVDDGQDRGTKVIS